MTDEYKGFTCSHLESAFGIRFESHGVVVPYCNQVGEVHREKEFTTAGKARCWRGKNKSQIPYGLETLNSSIRVDDRLALSHGVTAFLTEGESDAWTLRVTYPGNPVLGLPGASSWKPEWKHLLEDFPVVYLSFDNDDAGRSLTDAVWPDLPWARRVKLPEGCDTRELIQLRGGVAEYERLLNDADYIAGVTRRILQTKSRNGARCVA